MAEFIIVNGVLQQYRGHDKQVEVPTGVKEIGYRAFYEAKNVEKVILPPGLKKISFQAFMNCPSLKEINFPSSLENVSREGFKNTAWLENYAEPAVYAGSLLLFVKDDPEEIIVREGTKIICIDAFRYCPHLKKVILPEGIETIEHRAFHSCRNLKSLELPKSLKNLGDRVFEDCRAIEITMQSTELKIGRKCFPDDTIIHLRNMTPQEIPANVQMQAIQAFAEDMEKQIAFNEAFLAKMKRYFHSRRRQLYSPAAKERPLLRLLLAWEIIPAEDVDLILDEILTSGDGEIVAAVLRYKEEHTNTELSADLFDDLSLAWDIAEDEKSEEDLKKEWGIKENIDGTITLMRYYGADMHLVVPSKIGDKQVNDIFADACSPKRYGLGSKSIARLNNIRQITIEDGITKIGRYAFAYCQNLEEVIIPESVEEIADYAFFGCKKLKYVNTAHTVEKIGPKAFAECDTSLDFSG